VLDEAQPVVTLVATPAAVMAATAFKNWRRSWLIGLSQIYCKYGLFDSIRLID
jgi:hypothetical protein